MRTYTKVGENYAKEDIDRAIDRVNFEPFRTSELPFMQGEAIKQVISQCNIPLKGIIQMDLHNIINVGGEEHGFYALDVNYKNGNAKVYITDSGCETVVVASDFKAF